MTCIVKVTETPAVTALAATLTRLAATTEPGGTIMVRLSAAGRFNERFTELAEGV